MQIHKTIIVAAVAFLIILAGLPALAQDVDNLKFPKLNKLEIPEIDRVTLDNGMRLYLVNDKALPIFRASLRINCGSYLEPAEKIGLAGICGNVMRTGGTMKWSGDEIDELLEAVGGSVETSIGLASGNASVNVLSEYTDLGLEVLADILRKPLFDEDKIELAKVQERSGISRRNDDAQEITFREYRKVIYGPESVFARQVEYATINAVTRDDLIEFHAKYFHPQNVQMAIWGDFDKSELLAKIDKYFGNWKQEGEPIPPLPEVVYSFDQRVFSVDKPDVNQTNIVLGHIGGKVTDDDYADRIVMNNIFGGSFGSRMFNAVRSKEGLAYATFGVYTANISYPGVFYGFASTKSETTGKAVKEIVKQIHRMQTDPPTEDEMRAGKDGYLNSFVFKFDTKSEVVNRLMGYDFHGLPDDFLQQIKEKVEAVTPEDVMEAAVRNLKPEKLRILAVGKSEDYDIALADLGLGEVTDIDITIPSGEEKSELAITPENLKKGKECLDRAIAASGGLENFKKIKGMQTEGNMVVTTPQGEMAFPVSSIELFPDKSKTIVLMMGQEMVDIRNGNVGWKMIAPGQYAPKTEDDFIKADKEDARNTIRIYQSSDDPAYQAVWDGTGDFGGTAVEYVALLDMEGEAICRLAFNAQTSMLLVKSYWGETMMGEGAVEEVFSNFVEFGGAKLAQSASISLNGTKIVQSDFTSTTINPDFPAGTFDEPK